MTNSPTPLQTLVLWALLAEGGSALATELKPGSAADRAALKALGLITEIKEKGRKRVEVSDRGWAWAAEHLDREISTRSTAGGAILRAWLTRLKRFLASQSDLSLATVLVPSKIAPAPPSVDTRARVRDAYLATTGGKYNARALLRDLRRELADMNRADLDAELLRLQSEDGASLMPLDNRAAITSADDEAAISVGGEARHLIWISR
jgi:hypothetical protein